MDFLAELEHMAVNAIEADNNMDMEPEAEARERWQTLFGYNQNKAAERIKTFRADFSRARVSGGHWEAVRGYYEASGYDREAYEYSLTHSDPGKSASATTSGAETEYLLRMEGPLDTPQKVVEMGELPVAPPILLATDSSGGSASFYRISGSTKRAILKNLPVSSFRPTFVRISLAKKSLSSNCMYPTLGWDTTLPHHRPSCDNDISPKQHEFPVWYFFYGTLAEPEILSQVLGLPDHPTLTPATVRGGCIKTWGKKYRALVDTQSDHHMVQGHAYLVKSQEHDEALRIYETEKYEVVRCKISMQHGAVVSGLTFRFVPAATDLD